MDKELSLMKKYIKSRSFEIDKYLNKSGGLKFKLSEFYKDEYMGLLFILNILVINDEECFNSEIKSSVCVDDFKNIESDPEPREETFNKFPFDLKAEDVNNFIEKYFKEFPKAEELNFQQSIEYLKKKSDYIYVYFSTRMNLVKKLYEGNNLSNYSFKENDDYRRLVYILYHISLNLDLDKYLLSSENLHSILTISSIGDLKEKLNRFYEDSNFKDDWKNAEIFSLFNIIKKAHDSIRKVEPTKEVKKIEGVEENDISSFSRNSLIPLQKPKFSWLNVLMIILTIIFILFVIWLLWRIFKN